MTEKTIEESVPVGETGKTGAIELRERGFAPKTLDEAFRLAKVMASSNLVPKEYRGKESDVLVAMQWGHELGLAPLQALQNIAVINGRPSIWGDAALALVMASGQVESFDEWEEHVEGEGLTAFCKTKRKGMGEQTRTFSEEDVKTAKLGNVHNTYPKRMRQMRARGFLLRDVYPDALKGLITREEAEDYPASAVPREIPPDKQVLPEHSEAPSAKEDRDVTPAEAIHFPNPTEEEKMKDVSETEEEADTGVDVPETLVEPDDGEADDTTDKEDTEGEASEPSEDEEPSLTAQMRKAVTNKRRYGWSIGKLEEKYGKKFVKLTTPELREIAGALKECRTDKQAVEKWLLNNIPEGSDEPVEEPVDVPDDNEFEKEALLSELEDLITKGVDAGHDLHDVLGIPRNWKDMKKKLSVDILTDLRDTLRDFLA